MGYRNRIAAATTAIVLAAALAGCSTPPRTPEDAASPSADAAAPSETESQGWNRADLSFAEEMGDHAAGSVELAVAALEVRDLPQEAEELAVQIRDEQGPQARTLAQLAEEWSGEEGGSGANGTEDREEAGGASASGGSEDGGADGTASDAASEADIEAMSDTAFDSELQVLKAAAGTDAARLFLQGMIARHQAAIELADGESQLGTSTEALDLAGAMSSAQGDQLTKMRALLASYGG
ncbi:DUF305 domain-containing protein [Clavibacter lycopersici]|uniref:DUF305 domain-containing protein n=1 Tax=Clavibacter lycopersici TaxID=2301718 RepID=A0A399SU12_9MICO|nr:DUF305 domain-containing protein [Clavibacter lycopersici]RIJ46022.1 DUF305 domain-containing protein [Clavibacter lycopersici]RIJ62441.1 DUF305 domain-containing protein [Clavibacter lycopersici]